MTNQMTIFNNAEFGEIRTVEINNEPWFVGKDICVLFGDKNHNRSLGRIGNEDKRKYEITDLLGRKQEIIVINESGLYSLLFAMQPQKANNGGDSDAYPIETQERIAKLRQFKRWVTSEVLPSIRKTGSYTVPQAQPNNMDLSAMELEATGKYADILVKRFNLTQEHAMLYAMKFGKEEGKYKAITNNEIEGLKKLLPPITDTNTAKFNATNLGKELQNRFNCQKPISAIKVNDALCTLGYQTKIQGKWELTDSGKEYANSFVYEQNGHTGFQILWKSDVLDILEDNRELFNF